MKGGKRRITRIAELVSVADGEYQIEEIYGYRQTGIDDDGNAIGHFYTTGYQPHCLEKISAAGIGMSNTLFQKTI